VEEGIESPVFAFSDVFSEPSVVTKNSGQTVHKNIYYNGMYVYVHIFKCMRICVCVCRCMVTCGDVFFGAVCGD